MKSLCLPVFVCDFLNSKLNCIFGINAGRAFKFVHCCDTGTMCFQDYLDQTPLICIKKVIPQEDSCYARVLKRVVIKPQSFAPVKVGKCNSMPPHKWCSTLVQTAYGRSVVLQCYKEWLISPKVYVNNLTEHDLIWSSINIKLNYLVNVLQILTHS